MEDTKKTLQDKHETNGLRVQSNRDHIKKDNRDKLKYINTKARERDQSVKEIRTAI